MGVITFNGKTSTSIGLQVEVPPDYEIPERIYEVTPVPGRNGDVAMDTGAYRNVVREYQIAIGEESKDFISLATKLGAWLFPAQGYLRLEDTYEPDVFKLARFIGNNKITNILQKAGRATISFERMPQRFLKSGDVDVTVINTKKFDNPSQNEAKPLIKVYGSGSGTISFGDQTIGISDIPGDLYIDSELEECYRSGAINHNDKVTLNKGFPIFKPGSTTVTYNGGITKLEIKPRWWII